MVSLMKELRGDSHRAPTAPSTCGQQKFSRAHREKISRLLTQSAQQQHCMIKPKLCTGGVCLQQGPQKPLIILMSQDTSGRL